MYTPTPQPPVEIVEVGPRDGLQNESVLVSTEAKAELVRRDVLAGIRLVEITGFVHPRPCRRWQTPSGSVRRSATSRGCRASASCSTSGAATVRWPAGVDEVNAVVVADTFGERNQGSPRRRASRSGSAWPSARLPRQVAG